MKDKKNSESKDNSTAKDPKENKLTNAELNSILNDLNKVIEGEHVKKELINRDMVSESSVYQESEDEGTEKGHASNQYTEHKDPSQPSPSSSSMNN